MFVNLLEGLEKRFNNEFEFYDKHGLYRRIFPKNDFEHCETKIDLSTPDGLEERDLKDIYEGFKNLRSAFIATGHETLYEDGYHFICSVESLQDSLMLKIFSNNKIGEISGQTGSVINMFQMRKTFFYLEYVFKELSQFTGNKDIPDLLINLPTSYSRAAIHCSFITSRNQAHYRTKLDEYMAIQAFYEVYKYLESDSPDKSSKYYIKLNHRLSPYFYSETKIIALFESLIDVRFLYLDVIKSLRKMSEESPDAELDILLERTRDAAHHFAEETTESRNAESRTNIN
ncbi:hypothetical protein [Vibrio sp. 99-8-1]|uniref:hypothetical protein n=1 Tax=Vibrio sp. 99-8-1 TaxID=2607602 RepID=UPI0014935DA8|nr:hypothetical protein [Vibrio sp. 99-8-1]NOI65989.1 hypothetical protein [Vibrio sp. 99-8-1]